MPAEARPQKNGEVDAGGVALAAKLRMWCLEREGEAPSGGVAVLVFLFGSENKTKHNKQTKQT